MKKIGILLLGFLVLSIFTTILVQVQAQEIPPLPPGIEKLAEIGKNLTDDEARRAYFSQEWKEMLLKNKFISEIDSFFTEITILFRIFFGMPYSLSITLFLVIILWIIIALQGAKIVRNGFGIPEGISYLIGIAIAITLSQIQLLRRLIVFLTKFIFYRESAWARFIVFVVIIGIFILIYYFGGALSAFLEQRRKKKKGEETETKQKEIKKFTKGLGQGAGI